MERAKSNSNTSFGNKSPRMFELFHKISSYITLMPFLIGIWSYSQVVSAKGLLKECQFCYSPFSRDETILGRSTSVLWNLGVPNYQPSFRTFISDMLELINTRPKSADQKKERNKIIFLCHVSFPPIQNK